MDWRIALGLSLTCLWLLTGSAYISSSVGWAGFVSLPVEEVGSFLEGAFAPLAFLWLVIGYFLQQQELIQNTQAMRAQATEIARTAEQATIQSENSLPLKSMHAKRRPYVWSKRCAISSAVFPACYIFQATALTATIR